ncbi:MAG: amino acid ABC transporter permease [Chromatiaceae bacterium]|nr:amino acid ABC transporter permease [Gammaproteobacteria bacterium]MCB1863256.1 amino acid ABC transporter permease [Gammaproteobacteria bacterium]MCB1880352.1 amino acid ABC transporter permease [Gammaproteobacteria bacterium]MCP5427112.1 amino acid ABC transporter permease [Chromatiaceae bacterium]MCP5446907.1 amino acid ABC transporter permease [Chromatiaceae bacterium]
MIKNNGFLPALPPPSTSVGVIGWLRQNLFPSPLNTVLTILAIYLIYLVTVPTVSWVFLNADWVGESRNACTSGGACWVFVAARFDLFMYGFYPESEYWRINLAFAILALLLVLLNIRQVPRRGWLAAFTLIGYPVVAFYLFSGGLFGLDEVETSRWGGLSLTLVLSGVGIVASLPIGIVLALGRNSQMPIVKAVSIVFIEFWRGVPLITVLFMSSVMLPLFLPEGTSFDKLLRAMIGIVLFESAYMAEVVRGGLAAIPRGQYEAAKALGLNYWKSMVLIILPQALKLVIPGIVNTFIALFKDTTLVLIIGLFDLLTTIEAGFKDSNWLGYAVEGYVFAALIYWIFCFSMSRYSQNLERKLHTGHAR